MESSPVLGMAGSFLFSETESVGARNVSLKGLSKAGFFNTAQPILRIPSGLEKMNRFIMPCDDSAQLT
jgi:hypothetical protein